MGKEFLLIGDLARETGVSVRTIRFYIEEGLLPTPQTRGRYSEFDQDYVHRIQLIKRLQDTYLPLKEIRRQMENLSSQEVKGLLQNLGSPLLHETLAVEASSQHITPAPAPEEPSSSALDYISRLLVNGQVSEGNDSQPYNLVNLNQRPSPPPNVRPAARAHPHKVWRHIFLAPGLELQVEQGLFLRHEMQIQQIIELTHQIFKI